MRVLITSGDKLRGLDAGEDSVGEGLPDHRGQSNGLQRDDVIAWSELDASRRITSPELHATTTDLAYILYTSGSTGRPKGVMLSHQNALTFIEWCAEEFQVRSDDHLSNHAPLHFDLSVFDVYNAIKAGATVYMVPEETATVPGEPGEVHRRRSRSPSGTRFLPRWCSCCCTANLKAEKLASLRDPAVRGRSFPDEVSEAAR